MDINDVLTLGDLIEVLIEHIHNDPQQAAGYELKLDNFIEDAAHSSFDKRYIIFMDISLVNEYHDVILKAEHIKAPTLALRKGLRSLIESMSMSEKLNNALIFSKLLDDNTIALRNLLSPKIDKNNYKLELKFKEILGAFFGPIFYIRDIREDQWHHIEEDTAKKFLKDEYDIKYAEALKPFYSIYKRFEQLTDEQKLYLELTNN